MDDDDSVNQDSIDGIPLPKLEHVRWLNEGVESWNQRRKDKPFKPVLTWVVFDEEAYARLSNVTGWPGPLIALDDLSGIDLSDADLRRSILTNGVFRGADFAGADLTGASAFGAHFHKADFRRADLSEFTASVGVFQGANFRDAKFYRMPGKGFWVPNSDLTDVDLSESDLRGANFSGSNLRRADLTDSDLTGANIVYSDLKDAKLEGARLWRTTFVNSILLAPDFASGKKFEFEEVTSIRDLTDLRSHIRDVYKNDIESGRVAIYFRGEPCTRFELRPTVMRDGLRRFESHLLTGLKTESPAAFAGCEYAIDELAIARHFRLPTRLLDVTRNPLVGVFWSTGECNGVEPPPRNESISGIDGLRDCSCMRPHESCDGRLHVFVVPRELVRPYDSDRVSIVANFARLPMLQQERLLTKREEDIEFDYIGSVDVAWDLPRYGMEAAMTSLLHNIQSEKPYFTGDIDMSHLFQVFVVEPRRSFDRIRAQSGAFMLSAFHERFEGDEVAKRMANAKLYDHHVLTIPSPKKDELLDELEWFGTSGQALYADVEAAADAVSRRFRKIARRLDSTMDEEDGLLAYGVPYRRE